MKYTTLVTLILTLSHIKVGVLGACDRGYFRCDTGRCIHDTWVCDGVDDCGDNTDEHDAECARRAAPTCSSTEWQCNDGACLPDAWHCDGDADCYDASDELDCEIKTCSPETEFLCDDGSCIIDRWRCDNDRDCPNGEDEAGCPTTSTPTPTACNAEQFQCENGPCIPAAHRCNGIRDCSDGSDESHCAGYKPLKACPNSQDYRCDDDETCIRLAWVCDGDRDCPFGEDEVNCPTRPAFHTILKLPAAIGQDARPLECDTSSGCECIPPYFYRCKKGKCISTLNICDERNDCGDWEDEPGGLECHQCTKDGLNGGCQHTCIELPHGYECACHNGYQRSSDSPYNCEDIDECKHDPGPCSNGQLCTNTIGRFTCQCPPGYVSTDNADDSLMCRVDNPTMPTLAFTTRNDIRSYDIDTGMLEALVTGLLGAVGLDTDASGNVVYWTDIVTEQISRSQTATNSMETLLHDVINADGLAYDWVNDNLYWTDNFFDRIEASRADGSYRMVIFDTGLDAPRGIALDPREGYMYYTDWGSNPKIVKAGMDGSERTILIDTRLKYPNDVTIDYEGRRLYWINAAESGKLESSDLYGDDRRELIGSERHVVGHPFSLAVFQDTVYWTDWREGAIFSTNKFTANNTRKLLDVSNVMDITLIHPTAKYNATSYCPTNDVSSCTHLCLASPNIQRFQCACPGTSRLRDDGRTCECSDGRVANTYGPYVCPALENHQNIPPPPDEHTTTPIPCPNDDDMKCSDEGGLEICVSREYQCDGIQHCLGGHDEAGCATPCSPEHFTCATGECIENAFVCDGLIHCLDGDDEADCAVCSDIPGQFLCDLFIGYPCVPNSVVCDGNVDCPNNNADEVNCSCAKDPLRFPCNPQLGYPCVSSDAVCNGTAECASGQDEMGCGCSEEFHYTCADGSCIPAHARCDGRYGDCADGSDEAGCDFPDTIAFRGLTKSWLREQGQSFTMHCTVELHSVNCVTEGTVRDIEVPKKAEWKQNNSATTDYECTKVNLPALPQP